jgi:DNA polymerase
MPEAEGKFRATLEGMTHSLAAWRDTLEELGVMGLVREPVPAVQPNPAVKTATRPEAIPPPRPPAPRSAPRSANLPPVFVPSLDPRGCPPPGAVAAAPTLADLHQLIEGCLACPLGSGRMKFVFGEGHPAARLMFVGEGPGRDEDLQGRPFVGRAGELLDKMIGAIGLRREETYIANVVKCRPPDNRTPTPDETRACLGYLHRQIELIRPTVIVTLGATPLREFVGISEGITKARGQWRRVRIGDREIPVMPTFHPAYVLRQYTQEVRRAVWQDLKAAKEWIDRPADD